jgi:hypothetical protein
MSKPIAADIRETMLTVVQDMLPKGPLDGSLQQSSVLQEAANRLGINRDPDLELALLTLWNDLFRTGYLAWGMNLSNPNAPFFHVTDRGRSALQRLSRDPGNPAGYLSHLQSIGELNPIAKSYLDEGLECFSAGLHKAAAVMLGAAAESIILELRENVLARLTNLGIEPSKQLLDWRIKTILDGLNELLASKAAQMPHDLRAEFESYWPAFTQQIRATRNEAGHPSTIDPVSPDGVHASFLVFPELVRLATRLLNWTGNIK